MNNLRSHIGEFVTFDHHFPAISPIATMRSFSNIPIPGVPAMTIRKIGQLVDVRKGGVAVIAIEVWTWDRDMREKAKLKQKVRTTKWLAVRSQDVKKVVTEDQLTSEQLNLLVNPTTPTKENP